MHLHVSEAPLYARMSGRLRPHTNRAGKSSLLAALVAEAPVTGGAVELRGTRVGYLPQVPSHSLSSNLLFFCNTL